MQTSSAKPRRETYAFITKYERARAIGTRMIQLSSGAPPLVEVGSETSPYAIARKEFDQGVLPLVVRRFVTEDTYEDWNIQELASETHAPRPHKTADDSAMGADEVAAS